MSIFYAAARIGRQIIVSDPDADTLVAASVRAKQQFKWLVKQELIKLDDFASSNSAPLPSENLQSWYSLEQSSRGLSLNHLIATASPYTTAQLREAQDRPFPSNNIPPDETNAKPRTVAARHARSLGLEIRNTPLCVGVGVFTDHQTSIPEGRCILRGNSVSIFPLSTPLNSIPLQLGASTLELSRRTTSGRRVC